MSAINLGPIKWGMQRDKDGHRDYTLVSKIVTTTKNDGPATVFNVPGVAAIGATWAIGNDLDLWAFCWPDWKVEQFASDQDGPGYLWTLSQHFSTRPLNRCQDNKIENPLSEPLKMGGGFSKRTIQGTKNKAGSLVTSSSGETFTGKNTEWEDNHSTVWVEANVASLPISTFTPMVDTLNDSPLWGQAARCIKLSNVTWTRNIYALCNYYFTVRYEFDINKNTFDRQIADEGSKVLLGWCPGSVYQQNRLDPLGIDPETFAFNFLNPNNFERYKDKDGNYLPKVSLDGLGRPAGMPGADAQHFISVQYYPQTNFLTLGIPTDFTTS